MAQAHISKFVYDFKSQNELKRRKKLTSLKHGTKRELKAQMKIVLNYFTRNSKLTISRTSCSNDFETALLLKFSIT
jgi:hypothetical protein